MFDYIELNADHSIYETTVPESWIGKSIVQLAVRQKYHISILAIKRGDVLEPLPKPEYIFENNETILIMGANKDIQKFIHF